MTKTDLLLDFKGKRKTLLSKNYRNMVLLVCRGHFELHKRIISEFG
jgi:hypothetical protein